eukprot:2793575-Prymnesium_polylepis.1
MIISEELTLDTPVAFSPGLAGPRRRDAVRALPARGGARGRVRGRAAMLHKPLLARRRRGTLGAVSLRRGAATRALHGRDRGFWTCVSRLDDSGVTPAMI